MMDNPEYGAPPLVSAFLEAVPTCGTEGEAAAGDKGLCIGRAVLTEGGHNRSLGRSTVHDYEMMDNPEYRAPPLVSAFLEAVPTYHLP